MALDRIHLSRFRNHAATRMEDTRGFNLLIGENGAGKTNVLEALSLFAPGRGLRRAALCEMAASDGEGGFAVGASLHSCDGEEPVRLGTAVEPDRPGRRLVRINSAAVTAVSLGEWLSIGWLTPAMDHLFTGSAGDRRRFLDRMTLALFPAHAGHATRYENALRERNRLLSGEVEADPAWLEATEAQMAAHGAALMQGRAATVTALMAELSALPAEPFARPDLAYAANASLERGAFVQELAQGRRRDRAAGRTLTGPHRDELEVRMASKDIPASSCSTGEQKALLIAITLAHAQLAARGRPGLLLLDEVAAHLDPIRREALFGRLRQSGAQIWLTGTELAPFEPLNAEAATWRVAKGVLERLS